MSDEINELTEVDKLTELTQLIDEEQDIGKTKNLIDLFNWQLSKRNISRVHKLNNLFDSVTDKMVERFTLKPDQFSNDDLLNYMKTVGGMLESSTKKIGEIDPPPQIINNTQVNLNIAEKFDRESRARILAAVQATLESSIHNDYEYIEGIEEIHTDEHG